MRAGMLRHRVTILAYAAEVADGHGGFTDGAATTIASRIPACVEPLTGRELERAMQIDPRAAFGVTLRFRSDVTVRQQVVFHDPDLGDQTFEVTSVRNEGQMRRELQLDCKEAVA